MDEIARLKRQREDDRDELERLSRELRQANETIQSLRSELENEHGEWLENQALIAELKKDKGWVRAEKLLNQQHDELRQLRQEIGLLKEVAGDGWQAWKEAVDKLKLIRSTAKIDGR